MEKPTLESLTKDFERQERELADLLESIAALGPRDVPPSFFDELDELCEPPLARSVAPFNFFGLRA